jgi:hypothetical protein
VLFIILAALFLLWRSHDVVPIVGGDQIFFYPIYESVAHDGVLRHPFMSPIHVSNDNLVLPNNDGGSPLIWHGWLQPLLLGNISRLMGGGGGIDAAFLSDSIIIICGVLLYLYATVKFMRCGPITQLFGGFITFSALFSYQGRPELLASVLLLLWFNLELRLSVGTMAFLTPLILSLVAATQPTVAIIASIIYLNILIIRHESTNPIRLWAVQNFSALLLLIMFVHYLYPYRLQDWIYGLYLHGEVQLSKNDHSGFITDWIANVNKPLHGLISFIGLIVLLALARRALPLIVSTSAALCAVAAVFLFGVRVPANVTVHIPRPFRRRASRGSWAA